MDLTRGRGEQGGEQEPAGIFPGGEGVHHGTDRGNPEVGEVQGHPDELKNEKHPVVFANRKKTRVERSRYVVSAEDGRWQAGIIPV